MQGLSIALLGCFACVLMIHSWLLMGLSKKIERIENQKNNKKKPPSYRSDGRNQREFSSRKEDEINKKGRIER